MTCDVLVLSISDFFVISTVSVSSYCIHGMCSRFKVCDIFDDVTHVVIDVNNSLRSVSREEVSIFHS